MRFEQIQPRAIAVMITACILVAFASAQETSTGEGDARDRLANLSTTEKEELLRKREQFQQLDDAEKARLRELHTTIASSPDRLRLEATMLQYHEWLKSLPGKERADLLKLPPAERIAEIKRLMQEQRAQQFRKLVATPPEPQDVRAIFAWFDGYVEAHEAELLATLPIAAQSRVEQVTDDSMRRKILVMALHQNNAEPKLPTPTAEDLQKLDERLSPQAKETLAKVTDPEEKLKLVQGWIRAAVMSRMLPPVSEERLLAFFRQNRARLSQDDPQRIEQLESLPRDEFYQEVRNIYYRERGPWRGHRRDDDDWRGGRDGDGRGRDDHGRGDRGPDHRNPDDNRPRRGRPDARGGDQTPPDRPVEFPPPPPGDSIESP